MDRMKVWCVFAILAVAWGFLGCSGGQGPQEERATLEEAQEATKEAIQKELNEEIEKARSARDMGDARLKAMDEAVKNTQ